MNHDSQPTPSERLTGGPGPESLKGRFLAPARAGGCGHRTAGRRRYDCEDCERTFWVEFGSPAAMDEFHDLSQPGENYGLCCPWCMGWALPPGPTDAPGEAGGPSLDGGGPAGSP